MNISRTDIKKQYARAKAAGWLPVFEDIADEHGTTVSHFLAIGSRETNLRNIKGDFQGGKYHGFGVMQVDVGTDPEFTKTWSEENAVPGILRGGDIYQEKVNQVKNGQGKSLSVKGKKFVGKPVMFDDIRRIATAAYNSGLWAYYHFSNGNHVDSTTTGKDYSRDVYDRAVEFAILREADGEVGALKSEVDLQGKYAREEHRKLIAAQDKKSTAQLKAEAEAELTKKDLEPAKAAEPGPQINVEHADQVKADSPLPVEGGRKDDAPKQATQGGNKSLIATIVGGLAGGGTAIVGWIQNNATLAVVGVVCGTIVLLALIFRQIIIDYFRMKYMADPTKINVR